MQVWYLAGTLVLANTIAAVAVVLVAALIVPTHATEEVRALQIGLRPVAPLLPSEKRV